jgi:hypothetical protein
LTDARWFVCAGVDQPALGPLRATVLVWRGEKKSFTFPLHPLHPYLRCVLRAVTLFGSRRGLAVAARVAFCLSESISIAFSRPLGFALQDDPSQRSGSKRQIPPFSWWVPPCCSGILERSGKGQTNTVCRFLFGCLSTACTSRCEPTCTIANGVLEISLT